MTRSSLLGLLAMSLIVAGAGGVRAEGKPDAGKKTVAACCPKHPDSHAKCCKKGAKCCQEAPKDAVKVCAVTGKPIDKCCGTKASPNPPCCQKGCKKK